MQNRNRMTEKNGTPVLSTCSGTSSTDIINNNWSLEYNEIKITKRPQVINSIFECTDSEKIMKDFIKNNLLKKSNSTSDLYLLYYKEKNNFLFFKNVKKFHSRNCIENNQSRIKYDKSESDVKNRQSTCFIHQHNDNLDSLSNISATDTVINMSKIKKPKRRRRSSFFKLPFRIWDTTSDDEQNDFSDSSSDQTSITGMNNEKSFIENDGHIMLPMSTGFPKPAPGQSIISFLSSDLSFSKLPLNCDYTDEFDINSGNAASAENLAISLLQKFNENQLPATASEIKWLISEQDVPHK
ncbi:hypothetical protein PGB90_002807 [Kerria lacca]